MREVANRVMFCHPVGWSHTLYCTVGDGPIYVEFILLLEENKEMKTEASYWAIENFKSVGGIGQTHCNPLFVKLFLLEICFNFILKIHDRFLVLKETVSRDFDPIFFHKSMAPRALINTLKYFRILLRFRAEISEFIFSCIARSSDSALCNIARSFSNFVSSKTSRYAT
jgi:hypothetical protein